MVVCRSWSNTNANQVICHIVVSSFVCKKSRDHIENKSWMAKVGKNWTPEKVISLKSNTQGTLY